METDKKNEKEVFKYVNHASIVWKFKFYGFLKNLQFFEPFLLLILLSWEYSFFQIGIFVMISQIFTYVFEIPSGILADKFGKKRELLMCFVFYIISFIFYFLGPFWLMVGLGSVFFGLGESFRSGTHKAMELQWMERNDLLPYKSYVYGKTRSWSLYGSAINSVLAVIIIMNVNADKWIFLAATVPFILDFILIYSYPSYMNEVVKEEKLSWIKQWKKTLSDLTIVFKNRNLRKGVMTSSIFDAIFSMLKDYIQPIMKAFIAILLIRFAIDASENDFYLKLVLAMIYVLFYLVSSISSNNAYFFIKKVKNQKKAIDILFDVFAIIILIEAVFMSLPFKNMIIPIMIILTYMVIYAVYNLRRPMLVGYIGELAPKNQRATILSVESQFKSIFSLILAPLFGLIIDLTSIQALFYIIPVVIILLNYFFFRGECNPMSEECFD